MQIAGEAAAVKKHKGLLSLPQCFAQGVMQLGLDPGKSFDTPSGRPIAISDGGSALPKILG